MKFLIEKLREWWYENALYKTRNPVSCDICQHPANRIVGQLFGKYWNWKKHICKDCYVFKKGQPWDAEPEKVWPPKFPNDDGPPSLKAEKVYENV